MYSSGFDDAATEWLTIEVRRCAVPMDKEISGHQIEEEQAQTHRHQKEDSNDSAG
jgi:hypothetical protein